MALRWPSNLHPTSCAFGRTRNPAAQTGAGVPFHYAPERQGSRPLWFAECTFELPSDKLRQFRATLETMDGQRAPYVMGDWANIYPAMHTAIKPVGRESYWEGPGGTELTWRYGSLPEPLRALMGSETTGLVIDFTDDSLPVDGHYGSAAIAWYSGAEALAGSEADFLAIDFTDISWAGDGHYGSALIGSSIAADALPAWSTRRIDYTVFAAGLTIDLDASAGSTRVRTAGWPASAVCLCRGDLIEIDQCLYMLQRHAWADASGIAWLYLSTPLLGDITTSSSFVIIAPGCQMRLNSVEWVVDRAWNDAFAIANCKFIELPDPSPVSGYYQLEDSSGYYELEDDSGYYEVE